MANGLGVFAVVTLIARGLRTAGVVERIFQEISVREPELRAVWPMMNSFDNCQGEGDGEREGGG